MGSAKAAKPKQSASSYGSGAEGEFKISVQYLKTNRIPFEVTLLSIGYAIKYVYKENFLMS